MVRRAAGVTSYYNRVQPANPATRNRRIERNEPKTYEDAIFGAKSLFGQALLCLTAILLVLNIINQVIKLCF